ncbi:hypothetical protein CPB83DRAFT_880870 [Crepidotus variabilis]|uniref:Uncharacterized protein n=1 Tax=Crepidotus variabilis TaxID=179855 RepID=A0A9P6EN77_9AGAR|nr:hypothetical protein CPB83DRAFT_880870 [Crepidotus variabilis]
MKSLFSRRNDQQTGQSKTKDSYKFWRSDKEQSSSKTTSNQPEAYATSRLQAESRTKRSTPKPSQSYSSPQDKPPAPPPTTGPGSSAEQIVYPSTRINTIPLPSTNSQQLPPLPPPRPPTSSRHRESDDVKPQQQVRSFTTPIYGAPSSHLRQEPSKATRYPHSRNDVATIVRREVWLPPPHAASTSRPAEGKEEWTREPMLSDEPERYRSSTEDRGVSRDPNRRDRERERTRDRERDRVREREPDRDRIRRPTEREETPRDRDLQRQRDAALERARDLEREQAREADRAREKEERDLERAKQREREIEKERQKQREREEERIKEVERERQRQREEERAKERDAERERQRQREREEERAREREREMERERQRQQEREEERAKEREKEVERERQRQREQREREEERTKERQKEIERERQRERDKEAEREREKEREREAEMERQRERDRELELAKEKEREVERVRQREREKEKERERERQMERELEKQEREKERERERADKEKERERQREREREKDRERREQREKARQIERERRDRERELYERERLRREREVNPEVGASTKEATPGGPGPDPRPPIADLANDRERGKKEDLSSRVQTRQFDQAVTSETSARQPVPSHDDFRREKATRERHRTRDRERDPDQARYRAEATDVEPERYRSRAHGDRDRRRESRSGWVSDNHAGLNRKASRQIRQEPPQAEDAGDTSDGSINRVAGLPKLRRRDRISEAPITLNSKTAQYGQTPSIQPNSLPAYMTPRVTPFHLPTVESRNYDPTQRNLASLTEPSKYNEGDGAVRREINRHKLQEDLRNEPLNIIEQPQRPPSRASIMHGSSSTQYLPFSAPFGNGPSGSQATQRATSNTAPTFSGTNNTTGNGSKEKLPTRKHSEELRLPTTSNVRQADSLPGNAFINTNPGSMQYGLTLGETRDRKPYGHLSQPSGESRYPSHTPMGHSRVPSDDQKEVRGASETHASMPAVTPLTNVMQSSIRHVEKVKPSPPFPSNTLQTPSLAPRALTDELAGRAADGFRQAIASTPSHGTSNKLTTQSSAPPHLHPPAAHSKATTVVPDFPLFLTGIPPGEKPAGKDVVHGVFSPPSQTQALHRPIAASLLIPSEQKQAFPLSQELVNPGILSDYKAHHSDSDDLTSKNRQDAKAPEQVNLWAPTPVKNVETAVNQQILVGSSIQRPSTRNQNSRYSVLQPPNGVTSTATSQPTIQDEVSKVQAQPNIASSIPTLIFPPDATPPNPFLNEPHQRQKPLPTLVREPLQEEAGPSINRPPTSMGSRRDLPDTRTALSVSLGPPAFKSSSERLPHTVDPTPTTNVFEGRRPSQDVANNAQVGASVERPATSMAGKRDHHSRPSHRPTGSGDRPRDVTTMALPEHPTSSQERLQQEQLGLSLGRPPMNNGSKQGYAAGPPPQLIRQSIEPRTTDFTVSQEVGTPTVRPPTTNGLKRVPLSNTNAYPTNIGSTEGQPWLQGPSVQSGIDARPPTATGHRKEHGTTALRRPEAPSNNAAPVAGHIREPTGGVLTALPIQPLPQMEESSTQRHHRANNVPMPTSSKSQNPANVDDRGAVQWRRQIVQEDATPPNTGQILSVSHNSQIAPPVGVEYQLSVGGRLEERVQHSAPHDSPKSRQRVENTPLVHNHVLMTVDDQRKVSKGESPQHRAEARGLGDQVTRGSPLVQAMTEVREVLWVQKQDSPKIGVTDHTSGPHINPSELQIVDSVPQIKIHRPATAMCTRANYHAIPDSNAFDKPRSDALLTIGPSPQSSRQNSGNPSSSQTDNGAAPQAPPRYSPLFKGQSANAGELQPDSSSQARSDVIPSKKVSTMPNTDTIHRTPAVDPIFPAHQANQGRYARSSPQVNDVQINALPTSGHLIEGGPHNRQQLQNTPRSRESPPEQRVEVEVDDIKSSGVTHQARTEVELLRSARPALQPLPANHSEIERTQTPLFQKIHHPKLAELLSSPPSSQPFTLKPATTRSSENIRNNLPVSSAPSNGYSQPIPNDAARSSPPEKAKDVLRFESRQRETTATKTIPTGYSQATSSQPRSVTIQDTPTQVTSSATKTRANLEPANNQMIPGMAVPKSQPSITNKPSEGYPSTRLASQPLDVRFGISSQTHDNARPPASVAPRSHPRHHQHSSSLPMNLPPSSGGGFEPARSSTPAVPQSQSQPPPLLSVQTKSHEHNDKRNLVLPSAPSEETILMTPSSLGQTSALKPTTSRQSTTPSVKSQTAKKGFLDRFRRSSTPAPAVQTQQFQVWHPNASTSTPEGSPGHHKRPASPEVETKIAPPSPPNPRVPISIDIPVRDRVQESISPAAQVFNPFNYLTKRRHYGVDNASMEARDGATSTIIGSPTASLLSAVAVQLPPNRDTRQATSEWLSNEEVHIQTRPKRRRHRPGVVIEAAEDPPENKQRPKRNATRYKRPKGSSKPPPSLPTNS